MSMYEDQESEFESFHNQATGGVYEAVFSCSFCGSDNYTFLDPSQGKLQQYVEDCQTCCRPNILSVFYDELEKKWTISAELE